MTTIKTAPPRPKLKDIPSVPESVPTDLRKVIVSMREHIQAFSGTRGTNPIISALGGPGGNNTIVSGQLPAPLPGPAPDLTPAADVANLSASPGFAHIFVEFDVPTYTQGGGNMHTLIYGVKRNVGDTTTPVTFPGEQAIVATIPNAQNFFAIPSDLGVEWHLWAAHVTKMGRRSTNIVGGATGVIATTGKVGHSDLGPLIVEAENLANGTITAAKIAAQAIELTKFANGIEPVTIITGGALPTVKSTSTIFYTDGKLYRWNGTAYVATLPAVDIVGQVVASQVNLAIGGGNLLANSSFETKASGNRPAGYLEYNNASISTTYTAPAGRSGGTAFGLVANGSTTNTFGVRTSSGITDGIVTGGPAGGWKPGVTYVVSWYAKKTNGAGWGSMFLRWNIAPAATVYLLQPTLTTSYQRFAVRITWGASVESAANLFVDCGHGFTTVEGDEIVVDDIQIEEGDTLTAYAPRATEILPGTITTTAIADDAITTAKLVAGSVVTGKIAAGAVTADQIAANAVTAGKVAANAITANEIAANAVTAGKVAANAISTNELAANAVTAAKIAANTITAGQIAAGAIGAQQIAAGAITTGKLLVTGQGAALNTDPNFADQTHWSFGYGSGTGTYQTGPGDGGVAPTYLSVVTSDTWVYDQNPPFPIDPNATYIERARVYAGNSGSGTLYLAVLFYDGAGTYIENSGWGGSWSGYPVSGVVPAVGWNSYSGDFGAGTPRPIPANAKSCRVGAILKYSTGDNTTGWGIQDLRVERKLGADLIVDGSIIASKLAANAIAVGSAAIEDGAIRRALIADLAVDDAKMANVSVSKLLAGTLGVGQYIRSIGYAPGVSGWNIDADGTARFRSLYIDGDSYFDGKVTIRRNDGTVMFTSGGTVNWADITPASGWLNSNQQWSEVSGAGRPEDGATVGATIGSNLGGAFTQASWDTYMTSAFIRSAHIQQLTANNLSVTAISETVNQGTTSSSPNPGRIEITANRIDVFDQFNQRRVRLGQR
jgi:hypothetical protein